MGHGTHWEAVLQNVEEDFSAAINLAAERGELLAERTIFDWNGPFGVSDARIALLRGDQSGFSSMAVIVSAGSKTYLHSAFPVFHSNSERYRVRIRQIRERSFGLEASVTAELGDAVLTFFDPYYAITKGQYEIGSDIEVRFTAIAYKVTVAGNAATVHHPEVGDITLDGAAILFPLTERNEQIDAQGGFGLAYITEPQSQADVDDYQFRAPIKAVCSADFLGRPTLRVSATVMRPSEGQEFDVEIGVLVRS